MLRSLLKFIIKQNSANNNLRLAATNQLLSTRGEHQVVDAAVKPSGEPFSKLRRDTELGIDYARIFANDLATHDLQLLRSPNARNKKQQFVIQGQRLIREALLAGLRMDALIFNNKTDLLALKQAVTANGVLFKHVKFYQSDDIKALTKYTAPETLIAIFQRPDATFFNNMQRRNAAAALPISVICDNIREPSNLGNIIRSCAALPCAQIIVTRGCCDPWERKVFDVSCGGQFRVPIRDNVNWANMQSKLPIDFEACHVYIAENNKAQIAAAAAVAVAGAAAAASKHIGYTELSGLGEHNVVVIGGESYGISESAYAFMRTAGDRGKCINIPIAPCTDSLNTATALTLILFEMKNKLNAACGNGVVQP